MWRYHVETNQWSDIAQHVSIGPEGAIWTGRNWNNAPASSTGHNGNAEFGPFMIEMIGDFDLGQDRLEGEQRLSALEVVVRVQQRFGLGAEALRFHNQMSAKTCPGSSLTRAEIVAALEKRHAELAPPTAPRTKGRRASPVAAPEPLFGRDALRVHSIVRDLVREEAGKTAAERVLADGGAAEPSTCGHLGTISFAPRSVQARGFDPSPATLAALRPHVVNLRQGRFSTSGRFATAASDVDAIFDTHLPRWADDLARRKQPLQLVFFAHGGLVSEDAGLEIASRQVQWWKDNGVYPIYFVWETGLLETVHDLLTGTGERAAARDVLEHVTDPVLERVAHPLGEKIWSGMKWSAGESVKPTTGGALYVAQRLSAFVKGRVDVGLHAVGHSAGSIFHAHFLPAALQEKAPAFRTVHFLAPASRVDLFKEKLLGLLGKGIGHLTLFTMAKDFEKDDTCAGVYRKSLLYLIYYALEAERETPILGLEESLRDDLVLRERLGLGPQANPLAEVVFSRTASSEGSRASQATSHGGFDDDPATMNSVLRRIKGLDDATAITPFTSDPPGLRDVGPRDDFGRGRPGAASSAAPAVHLRPARPQAESPSGHRLALCVGLNAYPTAPLQGCVADARAWAKALGTLGFETEMLLDGEATRASILDRLRRLVAAAQPGDQLVFQYAGHGTTVPDLSGDEKDGRDEALCPMDFAEGRLLLDDDVGEVFDGLRDGVLLVCFMDCCHSGTITRFAVGAPGGGGRPDERPRFVVADEAVVEAHRAFRSRLGPRAATRRRSAPVMREIVFTACRAEEVAFENGGHGDFTRHATAALASGIDGVTNGAFLDRITAAFGATPRQHPTFAPEGARGQALLRAGGPSRSLEEGLPSIGGAGVSPEVAHLLESVARLLSART